MERRPDRHFRFPALGDLVRREKEMPGDFKWMERDLRDEQGGETENDVNGESSTAKSREGDLLYLANSFEQNSPRSTGEE